MKILVAEAIAEEGLKFLHQNAEVDLKVGLKPEELEAIIGDYEALVVRSQTKVTAALLRAARKLVVVGRAGVGVDNIDLEAATRQGVLVLNSPAGNITSTAEHTIAMLLALARQIPQAHTSLRSGEWRREAFQGTQVRHKTLGIIGLGRVGTEVAELARGLRLRLLAYDPMVAAEHAERLGVRLVALDELLAQSDFITVHVPLTRATRGLIGAAELGRVKPTVRFINCARGGIIDEVALYEALEEGRVAGAAVDVFSQEPARDNILLRSDKVIVTPHLAASTSEAEANASLDVAEQVIDVLQGKPARHPVNAPAIPAEVLSVLGPYLTVGTILGRVAIQLVEGRLASITIRYEGEMANYDTAPLKAAVLGGLLESVTEERVNMVNANMIAARRGLNIAEQKESLCQTYANILTVEVHTSVSVTAVAGTSMFGETRLVRLNEYWIEIEPVGAYLLLTSHADRPGMVGAVGTIVGAAGVNISNMSVSRHAPGGKAMMALCLDDTLPPKHYEQILALPHMYSAKLVKL